MVIGKRVAIVVLVVLLAVGVVAVRGMTKVVRTVAASGEHPIYSVETDVRQVSLGINCAWDNADIPQLIAILEQYNVKATFFVVGDWCDSYPESVKMLYDAGHEIGSHSDTHADLAKLDEEGIHRELKDSAAKIESVTGKAPELVRPPSGSYNNTVVRVIREEGYYPIQWDCDSIDYRNPTIEEMQKRIMGKLRCGSILLFHSGAKNTPAALPVIIEAIQAEGYQFVPVGELIYRGDYSVDFEGRQHKPDEV